MKHISPKIIACLIFLFAFHLAKAQTSFFTDITARTINPDELRTVVPEKSRNLSLDTSGLLDFFTTISTQKKINDTASVIVIPMPNGTMSRFHIWENDIMEPVLAAKFTMLKTYVGEGIDDSTATIKLDWTAFGFHAMILSPVTGAVFIDPYVQGDRHEYISYFKSDVKQKGSFVEPELKDNRSTFGLKPRVLSGPQCVGPQLLTYRLAVACTGEYAVAATGSSTPTVTQTLSAILTTVNRIDGVYTTEFAIHFVLVANEDHIIFTDPSTDPFTGNNDGPVLIDQSQTVIDDSIGNANYDIGHTFSTGTGGLSIIGVVCDAGVKASSITGIGSPIGDPFSIDYVAHEIGHEFGAHHPFNSNAGFCGASGQQSNTTNDEPGSGSTIMAYAEGPVSNGLCGSDNLQLHSDPYFNGINFDEITQYTISGDGSTCPIITTTGNNAPVVNAGSAYTIPVATPFVLTGSATDPDGDALTYCWEQVDVGGPFGPWNGPTGDAPIFRSFLPVTSPSRYFPQLSDVINNVTTIGEILPSYSRTMHFRLTARDNRSVGGGVCFAETSVIVDGSSGPFIVTNPTATNIIWYGNDVQTVTWNVANTASYPVNCSNVNILLSTDGGFSYSDTLVANAPNTGTAQIKVPMQLTNEARIKIESAGNVFYDISDNNFSIQNSELSLSVVKQGTNTAQLSWTAYEINTSYYNVERSSDDKNFIVVGQVPSTTGNGLQQYAYANVTTQNGINYYRIQEVEMDSSSIYSDTVSITIAPQWKVFPNPATDKISIECTIDLTNVSAEIFNTEGKLLYKDQFGAIAGNTAATIPLDQFAKGVYILKIYSNAGTKEQKIVVQ
ncbi:MAG TPA: zinc-dependent metalloprotease family protein [Ferruginibacter sp.]|nr:zinc-dependent metalloprotease family protein [Ferruginibacter sp.]